MRHDGGPWAGVRRLVAAGCLGLTLVVAAACGSGSKDAGGPTSPEPSTVAPTTPAPSTPTFRPGSGRITPTGKPTTTAPPSPVASIGADCLQPSDHARRVAFKSSTGATLTGALLGSGRAGVVLAHQSDGTLCQWLPYARDLARAGYLALTIDLEGHGSAGFVQYAGDQPVPFAFDIASAAAYLRGQGARKVVLVGASMGASSVVAGGAITRPVVNGVVCLSGAREFAVMDSGAAAAKLTVPVLYVAATEDMTVGQDYAALARSLYQATKSPRSLVLVPGALHGYELVEDPGVPKVRTAVDAFVAAHAR